MGYTIPGADYTSSPQLQTNVGAQGGKFAASAIARFTQAWQANQEKTNKLKAVKDEYSTQTTLANNNIINATLKGGETDYGGKDSGTYKTWEAEVVKRGKLATQAQMDIRFGGLNEEDKQSQLNIINDFNNYTNSSTETMGKYIADIKAYQDPSTRSKNTIIGDPNNGEQLRNIVTMDAASGKNIEGIFGVGAKTNRVLTVDGDQNIINSTVSIPMEGTWMKNMTSTNPEFGNVIAAGIKNKNIIEKDGQYIFKREINLNAYEGDSGFDFVIPLKERIQQDKLLQESGVLDKNMAFKDTFYANVNDGGTPDDLTDDKKIATFVKNASYGKDSTQTTEFQVLNMAQLAGNKVFLKSVNVEAETLLLPGTSTQVQAANLMNSYGVSSMEGFGMQNPATNKPWKSVEEFLNSGDKKEQLTFVNNAIKKSVFNDMFSNQVGGSDKEKFVMLPAEGEMLKYLNDNNIRNEQGDEYSQGDPVYTKQIQNTPIKKTTPKELSYNTKVYNNLQKGMDESVLFGALTKTPAETNIMYTTKDGVKGTYVMIKGFPTGTALKPKALNNLFKP